MGSELRVNTKREASVKEINEEVGVVLEPLSPLSEVFLNTSKESQAYILAVFESEICIQETAVYKYLEHDFIPTSPRYSSIAIEDNKGKKRWKRVEVKVKDHVKVPVFPSDLSPEMYNQHFDDYMSKIAKEQVSDDQPLWELHLFKYPTTRPSQSHEVVVSGTFIFKFHHAIADGISLMGSLYSCFRRADDESLPLTFPSASASATPRGKDVSSNILCTVPKFISWVFSSFHDFGQSLGRAFFEDDRTPISSRTTNAFRDSFSYRTIIFSLDEVKRIKGLLGLTVNDVVVGTIFLGLQLYMQEMKPGLRRFRSTAAVPVNVRSTKGYARSQEMHKDNAKVPWGNKFQAIQIPIPNFDQDTLANPLNVVMEASKIIKRKRKSFGQYLMSKLIVAIGTCVSPKEAARIFYGTLGKSSLVISNLIGPIQQMSLATHPVTGFYFLLAGVIHSLTVTVMSYMQTLRIGLTIEADYIKQERLIECIQNAFHLILQAAIATAHQPTN